VDFAVCFMLNYAVGFRNTKNIIPYVVIFTLFLGLVSVSPVSARRSAPSKVKASAKTAIVNVPAASIYLKNSASSERTSEVLLGDEFRISEVNQGWAYGTIPSQKGYRGWISVKDITFPSGGSYPADRPFIQVRAKNVKITTADGSTFPVFVSTRLPLKQQTEDEYVVFLPDGRTGRLPVSTSIVEDRTFGKHVTSTDIMDAAEFLGSDYKWGGITPWGMDCSGFVYTVFRMNGIYLKRDSYMQAYEGTEISAEDMQPGDLLFFRTTGRKRITHVGIYIGDGNFIHASKSHNAVIISSLDGYFRKKLAATRRIIHSSQTVVSSRI